MGEGTLFYIKLNLESKMSTIRLQIEHKYSLADAKTKIKEQLDDISEKFGLNCDWDDNVCKVSGPVKGSIEVTESDVLVEISLGFSMKLFKNKIETKLKEGLQRALR